MARRILAALSVATLATGSVLAMAAPAQAASHAITIDCANPAAVVLPGSPGDTYDITLMANCEWLWNAPFNEYVSGDGYVGETLGFLGQPTNIPDIAYYEYCDDFCNVALDGWDWYFYADGIDEVGTGIELLSVNEHGDVLSPGMRVGSVWSNALDTKIDIVWGTSATAQAPPSWYQSYQRPSADAACDAGWSPSWAQWPAGGQGGFVCNKEIYWSIATGGWSTRSKTLR